jgi:hypothetical protein
MESGSCLVCKGSLNHFDKPRFGKCQGCGVKEKTYILCENDHYLCNSCASDKVMELLYKILPTIEHENPVDALEFIVRHCGIVGNTPHPITAAAFLSAVKNATARITHEEVLEGVVRASQIPGGWCGYYGTCGAGVALGTAFSVISKATPMSDKERSSANVATATVLMEIAKLGGPRCCLASARVSLDCSIDLARDTFAIEFPKQKTNFKRCCYSSFQRECKKELCKYFNTDNTSIAKV